MPEEQVQHTEPFESRGLKCQLVTRGGGVTDARGRARGPMTEDFTGPL